MAMAGETLAWRRPEKERKLNVGEFLELDVFERLKVARVRLWGFK